jgi:hypothetical protein
MSESALNELQELDAVAAERGLVLGFRVCENGEDLEPVFFRFFKTRTDDGHETALISIDDDQGFQLGRYILPRERIDAALDQAEDLSEDPFRQTVLPADW